MRQTPHCKAGYRPIAFQDDPTLCGLDVCGGGTATDGSPMYPNDCTWWRLGDGLKNHPGFSLTRMGSAVVQTEEGHGCVDSNGRYYVNCDHLYTHPEGPAAPYTHGGYPVPDYCSAATPTPRPTAGPSPTPGAFPPQPKDFRLNFVNACQNLGYVTQRETGEWRGMCDATYRFIGTLASGERWGNSCDSDHWLCAVQHNCQPQDQAAAEKTAELCGSREWYSPQGVNLHVRGANHFEVADDNPYQHWIYFNHGADIYIYGCAPDGAKTDDGKVIPGTPGCGTEKHVNY